VTNQSFVTAKQALSSGDLGLAERLSSQLTTSTEALALQSEVLYLIGRSDLALEHARDVANRIGADASVKAYASLIAGACSWGLARISSTELRPTRKN
jgi:hypothetical protein